MAEIKINVKMKVEQVVKDLDALGKDIVNDLKKQIGIFAKSVHNEGLRLADQRLKTSASLWKDNFKFQKTGDIYEVYLVDESLANDYEEGFEGFDMKPGFLGSSKAKKGKNGSIYFDVPFHIQPMAKTPAGANITDMRSAVAAVLKDETVSKKIEEYNKGAAGYRDWETDRKSTRLNSSHSAKSRMPSSA